MKIRTLTSAAMMAALTAILAQIAIPIGPAPVTLQTVALILTTCIFDSRRAALSFAIYILLGTIGLPVFAGGKAGPAVLIGPTGGFLIGFIIAAAIGAALLRNQKWSSLKYCYLATFTASLICLACGGLWFALVGSVPLGAAFATVVLPFIAIDLAKAALFTPCGLAVHRALHTQFPKDF